MLHYQIGELTFTVPSDWDEMSLGQFLAYLDAEEEPELVSVLSGLSVEQLRPLAAPELSLMLMRLPYLQQIPAWDTWPVPTELLINEQWIILPADLDKVVLIGQLWDIERVDKTMLKQGEQSTYLNMARTVLSVLLWPVLKAEPYQDTEQAAALIPLLESMPVTQLMPLSAHLFETYRNPKPSGKIKSWEVPSSLTPRPHLLQRIKGRVMRKWNNYLSRQLMRQLGQMQ